MSDEQRKDETDVEGHGYPPKYGASDDTPDDDENEFEAHIRSLPNVRMDSPRDT
jgi:hypothetical protein